MVRPPDHAGWIAAVTGRSWTPVTTSPAVSRASQSGITAEASKGVIQRPRTRPAGALVVARSRIAAGRTEVPIVGPLGKLPHSEGCPGAPTGGAWPVVEIDSICCSGGAKYIGAGSFQRDSITERRQTEEARRGSEERFRQFAGASADVLWIRDAETLRLASVGSALERIDGLPSGYRLHQTATRSEAGSGWSCRRSVAPRRSPAFCGIDRDRYD